MRPLIGAEDTRLSLKQSLKRAIIYAEAGDWEQVERCLKKSLDLATELTRFFEEERR